MVEALLLPAKQVSVNMNAQGDEEMRSLLGRGRLKGCTTKVRFSIQVSFCVLIVLRVCTRVVGRRCVLSLSSFEWDSRADGTKK